MNRQRRKIPKGHKSSEERIEEAITLERERQKAELEEREKLEAERLQKEAEATELKIKEEQRLQDERNYQESISCNQYAISLLKQVQKSLNDFRRKNSQRSDLFEVEQLEKVCIEQYQWVVENINKNYRNSECIPFLQETINNLAINTKSVKINGLNEDDLINPKYYFPEIDPLISEVINKIKNYNGELTGAYYLNKIQR